MPPSTKARRRWIGVAVLNAPRVLSDEAGRIVATVLHEFLHGAVWLHNIYGSCSQESTGPWLDPEPMKTQQHSQNDQK